MSKIPQWIVMDHNTMEACCQRCSQRERIPLPMPISAFAKWCEYFSDRHKFCKPTPPAPASASEQAQPTTQETTPWTGKLHHARELCDDWGCIRDEAHNLIIRVSLPTYDESRLNEHRKNKTDPTQERVDAILSALNNEKGPTP